MSSNSRPFHLVGGRSGSLIEGVEGETGKTKKNSVQELDTCLCGKMSMISFQPPLGIFF